MRFQITGRILRLRASGKSHTGEQDNCSRISRFMHHEGEQVLRLRIVYLSFPHSIIVRFVSTSKMPVTIVHAAIRENSHSAVMPDMIHYKGEHANDDADDAFEGRVPPARLTFRRVSAEHDRQHDKREIGIDEARRSSGNYSLTCRADLP